MWCAEYSQFKNSMEQSPSWEAKRSSACQEIPCVLWNPKLHYRIPKRPPPVPMLCQNNPVQASPSHFLKIHFNIILPSMPRFSKLSPSLGSPHQKSCMHLSSPPYVPESPHISFFMIWSSELYLVRSTERKAPRYVVSSIPLFTRFYRTQIKIKCIQTSETHKITSSVMGGKFWVSSSGTLRTDTQYTAGWCTELTTQQAESESYQFQILWCTYF